MKENGFKFKESYANSIKAMNDKQAGKFIKFLCDYVFLGRLPETNDATIKSTFNLILILMKHMSRLSLRDNNHKIVLNFSRYC